jgi:hypothetical protein
MDVVAPSRVRVGVGQRLDTTSLTSKRTLRFVFELVGNLQTAWSGLWPLSPGLGRSFAGSSSL